MCIGERVAGELRRNALSVRRSPVVHVSPIMPPTIWMATHFSLFRTRTVEHYCMHGSSEQLEDVMEIFGDDRPLCNQHDSSPLIGLDTIGIFAERELMRVPTTGTREYLRDGQCWQKRAATFAQEL